MVVHKSSDVEIVTLLAPYLMNFHCHNYVMTPSAILDLLEPQLVGEESLESFKRTL